MEFHNASIPVDRGERKVCLAACVDQTHTFLITQSNFPNKESLHRRPEFCLVYDKLMGEKAFYINLDIDPLRRVIHTFSFIHIQCEQRKYFPLQHGAVSDEDALDTTWKSLKACLSYPRSHTSS